MMHFSCTGIQISSKSSRSGDPRNLPDANDAPVELALEAASAETDEAALVRQRIERKLKFVLGAKKGREIDDKKIASLYRSLLRAGFSADIIRRELRSLTKEDVPEVESDPE